LNEGLQFPWLPCQFCVFRLVIPGRLAIAELRLPCVAFLPFEADSFTGPFQQLTLGS